MKSSSFAKTLSSYTESKSQTLYIFIGGFSLSALILLVLGTYILAKFHVSDFIVRGIKTINNSSLTIPLGLVIITIVLIFNIFMFGYSWINKPDQPNIVLISIDTLRADRLGSYGHKRNTSPNIDMLAQEGIVFNNAYSQAPWTLPAMATIHSSLYPSEHGATRFDLKMNNNVVTLAEYLKNNFYKTIGVISHSFVSSMYGFEQGYDIFDEEIIMGAEGTSSEELTKKAKDYISENKDDTFFLWVHYFDPHYTYIHHEEYNYGKDYTGRLPQDLSIKFLNPNKSLLKQEDIEYVKDIYDEEISYTDYYIGEIIDKIEELGLKDNTVIILTSDHGEEFMERDTFGHGKRVYQELIQVPLIIYNPGESKKEVNDNVETRSIYKTILNISGIDYDNVGGIDLLAVENEKDRNYIYSEGSYAWGSDILTAAIIQDEYKLIKNYYDDTFELYNLISDPNEESNLYKSEDFNTRNKKDELLSILSSHKENRSKELEKVNLNEDDMKRLKSLGYIQ